MQFLNLALVVAASSALTTAEETSFSTLTYCTSTLTVPYPTPCTNDCRPTITATTYTESVSCAGCKYLSTTTAAPENGQYCPIAACASPIPTAYDYENTTTVTSCHPTTPWSGAGPSKK